MSFLKKYKTNQDAEKNGVWVEVDDGVELKVARLNNDNAREMRRKLEKPYRNFPTIPDHVQEGILRTVVAKTVLVDWKGITDDDGEAIPYSTEAAEKLFTDLPDFLSDVVSLSLARETFQTEGIDAVKNG